MFFFPVQTADMTLPMYTLIESAKRNYRKTRQKAVLLRFSIALQNTVITADLKPD